MMARVLRRLAAVQDVESIADHLAAATSLAAAVRFLENAEATLAELAESPGRRKGFGRGTEKNLILPRIAHGALSPTRPNAMRATNA